MLVRRSGARERPRAPKGDTPPQQSSTLTMAPAANVGVQLDSESRIWEIRLSGLMRGRSLTVIGHCLSIRRLRPTLHSSPRSAPTSWAQVPSDELQGLVRNYLTPVRGASPERRAAPATEPT